MGSMNDKQICCIRVFGPQYGFKGSPCSKPVKVIVDGKHYCATHDPAAVAKRAKASEDRFKATLAGYEAERQAQREQARKAACFDSLLAALETVYRSAAWPELTFDEATIVAAALNEARKP